MRLHRFTALWIGFGFAASASLPALAVPYASGLRNTEGTMWQFVLNEPADIVTITPNTGAPIVINNAAVGRHTVDLMGASSFDIAVSKSVAEAWTELSDPANLFTKFERPTGLAINKDASSPFFGTVYVAQSTNLPTAAAGAIPARTMAEGIYPLTADQVGVDLSTFMAVADAQSTAQSKRPASWVTDDTLTMTGGATNDNARSPHRITLDESGNLIVADWSTTSGGVKWAAADLTNGGPLLAIQDGEDATFAVRNSQSDDLHSRIPSLPYVTGSIGNNLTLTALDALLEVAVETPPVVSDRLNVWRWNIGNHDFTASPDGYDGTNMPPQSDFIVPDLVIAGNQLNRVHGPAQSQATGTQWFNSVPGVTVDMYYSPEHDLYYLTQPRSDGNQPSLLIVDANLAEDPTGQTPIVLFNSREWTKDHGLDGAIGVPGGILGGPTPESGRDGEDIFRMAGTVEISPDGSTMFLRRQQVIHIPLPSTFHNENPVLGNTSNNPYAVLAIPLDENGLPVIEIDDMGTPADTTDDRISNFSGFQIASQTSSAGAHEIELDAAGNVYVTNSISERLQVFSPGGSWTAITTSDGMFSLVPLEPPAGVPGDYNNNGVVDAADFVIWRKNLGTNTQLQNEGEDVTPGMVTTEDYDLWRMNFGMPDAPGSGSFAGAVPEPGTIALAMLALAALGASRRRAS